VNTFGVNDKSLISMMKKKVEKRLLTLSAPMELQSTHSTSSTKENTKSGIFSCLPKLNV
jgi:hypothetical protein